MTDDAYGSDQAFGADPADKQWQEAIALANVPTLALVLFQLTGEHKWLEPPYRPSRMRGLEDNDSGGLPIEVQEEIRAAALAAIRSWQAGAQPAIDRPDDALLVEMMSVAIGQPVADDYAPMIRNELRWFDDPIVATPPPAEFSVLIIGAGISGICAGVRLQQAGIPFTILERDDRVGGTWLQNRYPGCGVDTPSYLYCYPFARSDWRHHFALRDELFEYIEGVADGFGITPRVQFGVEVIRATYDADARGWVVEARDSDGRVSVLRCSVLISAVGAFNKPTIPDVAGVGTFAGPEVHTAKWPEDLDLRGRRVAVIGTGASAMQLVPAIVDEAAHVMVFQRTAQWAAPFEKFHKEVPGPLRRLLTEMPLYQDWYRLRLSWAFNDALYPVLQRDPDWDHPGRSISAHNDKHREFYTEYIVSELGDRQDLLEQVLPTYPPYSKRMLMDNGWFRTMTRPDVELVTGTVTEILPNGVRVGESVHLADVLVWATGFDVVHMLAPMEVIGRSGVPVSQQWEGDNARAYLGTVVPDLPNFFCLYGPNAQFGHGGSLITIMDRQMHYVMSLLEQMLARGIASVEVRQDVHDRYNDKVDATHSRMVWAHSGVDTYYKNSKGRVVSINPFRVVEYWQMTEHADLAEYILDGAQTDG